MQQSDHTKWNYWSCHELKWDCKVRQSKVYITVQRQVVSFYWTVRTTLHLSYVPSEPWVTSFLNMFFPRTKLLSLSAHNLSKNLYRMKIEQETLRVVTIAMICSTLASLWKFQNFWRLIYNPVEQLWWSFCCENSTPACVFTKKFPSRMLAWVLNTHLLLLEDSANVLFLLSVHYKTLEIYCF